MKKIPRTYRLREDLVVKLENEPNSTYIIETLLDNYYNKTIDKSVLIQLEKLVRLILSEEK